jgi:hypothetical protein
VFCVSVMKKVLRQAHIKQCQPILNRLQSKSAEDEPNAEGSESSLRKVVRIVFNIGIHRHANAGDKASHQSDPDRKRPCMVKTMHESATGKCRGNVAKGPNDRSPKLAASNAWTTTGDIVESGPHAARIGEYLACRDQSTECDCVFEAQNPVQSGPESKPADGAEQCFPRQGIMRQATSRTVKFDRDRNAGRKTRRKAKEKSKSDAVTDAKDDGIRYRPGQQAQRAVLPAQQVVRQIEAAQHIKKGARDADRSYSVVVDRHVMIVPESRPDRKKFRRESLSRMNAPAGTSTI